MSHVHIFLCKFNASLCDAVKVLHHHTTHINFRHLIVEDHMQVLKINLFLFIYVFKQSSECKYQCTTNPADPLELQPNSLQGDNEG